MDPIYIVLIVLGVVLLMITFWIIGEINSFRRMLVKIDESESSIDVALTKRFDLLTKMFQAAKGYMKHEAETLEKVVKMRQPAHAASIEDKQAFANELTRGLQAINVVVEQYPDLKASQNVSKLQDATLEVEENLQASRRVYNSNVSYYNQKVVVFPSNMIAKWKNFEKRAFFEAEALKREDVKFDF
ncbi:MAG: LemA family protein [Acholeplasmataceae bacterium]|jgi:LemA protein|nr:LemA family protein [Acholeplasmataceae bacterium]MDD4194499.1 LemA family protein [Acholeplasmataceae bacterium]MDY0338477.1 LemA family protein [Acholeplasmataceae bacterium]